MKTIRNLAAASSVFALSACSGIETDRQRVIYEGPHLECGNDVKCHDQGKLIKIDDTNGQVSGISGIAIYESYNDR